jgi:Ni2+-binding GTPase involved in maturation of urease and hydrogenase
MKLHVVGGFLGSGKTTAIAMAANTLRQRGQKVGIITNDKGKHLVDTLLFKSADLPTMEVGGGCFRCNYDQLDEKLNQLIEIHQPDIIFAESVGTCTDMITTVIEPLKNLRCSTEEETLFSVLVDARLLYKFLKHEELPFRDGIVYIFKTQIEEAGILVINKIDLLSLEQRSDLLKLAESAFPKKRLIMQSALSQEGVESWIASMNWGLVLPEQVVAIDYQPYGEGETKLAWFDGTYRLNIQDDANRDTLRVFIDEIIEQIQSKARSVGHVKFFIDSPSFKSKISLVSLEDGINLESGFSEMLGEVSFSINARVETDDTYLKAWVHQAFTRAFNNPADEIEVVSERSFHPMVLKRPEKYPDPVNCVSQD